jgi:hypothetical protein
LQPFHGKLVIATRAVFKEFLKPPACLFLFFRGQIDHHAVGLHDALD